MSKIKAGIVGAAGYTAGELIRILLYHPGVELASLQSESQVEKPVFKVHDDLLGDTDLKFEGELSGDLDVIFLCRGHGQSLEYLKTHNISKKTKIIDLSQDFRIQGTGEEVTGRMGEFVYGLPELYRDEIKTAKNVANPGCFATCLQLGLLPLAKEGLLHGKVHISAITGSTGAGQKLSGTSHFSWRNNNMSVYKPFQHQHLKEIHQSLQYLQPGLDDVVRFIPYRGNFTRGIIATMYLMFDNDRDMATELYKQYYQDHPYTHISGSNIHMKQVVNTNKCLLYIDKIGNDLMIISAIDNLLKGASGQAVQNMNLMFGLPETQGLNFKPSAF